MARGKKTAETNGAASATAVADAPEFTLDVDSEFGSVSLGKETTSVGCKVDRAAVTREDCETHLCGHRVMAQMSLQDRADEKQKRLPALKDNVPPTVAAIADIKSFNTKPGTVTFTLVFGLDGIDESTMRRFVGKSGRLRIAVLESRDDDDDADDEDRKTLFDRGE